MPARAMYTHALRDPRAHAHTPPSQQRCAAPCPRVVPCHWQEPLSFVHTTMASYAAQLRAQLGTQVNLRRRMFDDSQGKVKAWWFRTCIPTCVRDGLFQGTMGLYTDLLHVVHTVAAVLESHPHAYAVRAVPWWRERTSSMTGRVIGARC